MRAARSLVYVALAALVTGFIAMPVQTASAAASSSVTRALFVDTSSVWALRTRDGLRFSITTDPNRPRRVGLVVSNTSSEDREIRFPTAKTHEIALFKDGVKLWGSADGKAYAQTAWTEKLAAKRSKTYWSQLPWLAPGEYELRAYFDGIRRQSPVVIARVYVGTTWWGGSWWLRNPLAYSVSFQKGFAAGQGQPKIVITVKNPTGEEVILPGPHSYEVVIYGDDGSVTTKVVPGMSPNAYVEQMGPGALRTYFVYLNGLRSGGYYAEVSVNEGVYGPRLIGSLTFRI